MEKHEAWLALHALATGRFPPASVTKIILVRKKTHLFSFFFALITTGISGMMTGRVLNLKKSMVLCA